MKTNTYDTISAAANSVDKDGGKAAANAAVPVEVVNLVIFVDHLCRYATIPRALVHEFIPAYTFDAVQIIVGDKK